MKITEFCGWFTFICWLIIAMIELIIIITGAITLSIVIRFLLEIACCIYSFWFAKITSGQKEDN